MKLAGGCLAFAFVVAVAGCVVQQPAQSPGGAPDLASQVPGRYVAMIDGQASVLTLNADGTGDLSGHAGQWQVQNGMLLLSDGEQWAPATLEGEQLTVQLAEGQVVFVREGAAGAPAPGEPAGAGAPVAGGPVDSRLVGCWEDFSGSSGGTGSHSFQRTVEFAADGRYQARTFSSVSAGDLSSSNEDSEAGSWSADGSTLSLSPSSGAPYQSTFQLDGGLLFLNGNKYVPCS